LAGADIPRRGVRCCALLARALSIVIVSVTCAALAAPPAAAADGHCAGDGPWVLVSLRADAWSEAQRQSMINDLGHTLASQGIGACAGEAHPVSAPLATLAVELSPASKATVDIEVRDAVTRKRVRRDVDLSRIPDDGHAAAIAIEADELLRASWAEVALDTARARQAQEAARPQVVGSVQQVMAPSAAEGGGGLGARAAVEHYVGGTTLVGADGVGRVRLSPRIELEIAGALRIAPSVDAPHGRVNALGAGGGAALLVRVAGGRRASLAAGAGASAGWLEFRAEPAAGAAAAAYGNLLVVGRLRLLGRLALGRSVHATAGIDAGVALRGVEATDAGEVVGSARGVVLGATLGLEAP